MIKTLLSSSLLMFSLFLSLSKLQGQVIRCATNEIRATDASPEHTWDVSKIHQIYQLNQIQQRTIIKIPVVVHVVWNTTEENISDEQILSQIETLNRDFRAMDVEISNLPAAFRTVFADTEIEFCLAKTDYRGRATDGINRVFTTEIGIADNSAIIKNSSFGGEDAWDTKRFLNIWVGRRNDGILAEATLPGEATDEEDGIVIDYRAFGNTGTASDNAPYNLGRTLTHEVGHYLGLQHLWGAGINNANCDKDDGLNDTPFQQSTFSQMCPNGENTSCSSIDMYMNFMNYTNDACMSIFTADQKSVMHLVLNTIRKDLRADDLCDIMSTTNSILSEETVNITPNPAYNWINIEISADLVLNIQATLYNALGQVVRSFDMKNARIYTLEMRNLSAGIYYIKIYNNKQSITKPILLHPN